MLFLSKFKYQTCLQSMHLISKFLMHYIPRLLPGAVAGIYSLDAGISYSAGKCSYIIIALVEQMKASDHCVDPFTGICLHHFVYYIIRAGM